MEICGEAIATVLVAVAIVSATPCRALFRVLHIGAPLTLPTDL